ncbi:hypothetical protein HDV00_009939 [Rhizophlyctis rosea]|nr:hypothetical protein HDV00_009939 [Rhizophlyctis rosea]
MHKKEVDNHCLNVQWAVTTPRFRRSPNNRSRGGRPSDHYSPQPRGSRSPVGTFRTSISAHESPEAAVPPNKRTDEPAPDAVFETSGPDEAKRDVNVGMGLPPKKRRREVVNMDDDHDAVAGHKERKEAEDFADLRNMLWKEFDEKQNLLDQKHREFEEKQKKWERDAIEQMRKWKDEFEEDVRGWKKAFDDQAQEWFTARNWEWENGYDESATMQEN